MSDKVIKKFEDEMKDFHDRLRILEDKMKRLEKTRQELERVKDALVEIFGISLTALEIDYSFRDLTSIVERLSVDVVKTLMGEHLKGVKRFVEQYYRSPWKEAVSKLMKRWVAHIFMIAAITEIEFDDFCSMLIENLGSDLARKIIPLEHVVKLYGAENASTWKKLTK